jgi:plastocyanin
MGYADAGGVFTLSGAVQSSNHYQTWWAEYPLTMLKAMSPSNHNWTGYADQVDILIDIVEYNGTGVASAPTSPTPPTPTASCPTPGTTATISWSAVSGADYYSVWAYDQSGTQVLNKGSVTGTSASFTTSPGNYTYYVNLHQNGNWYPGSSKSFTCTGTAVSTPTPPTPTASCPSPGTTATISWSAVSGADYYSVWAYDQTGTQVLNKGSVTGTSASFTTSPGNYTYYVNLHQNGNWYQGSSKSLTCTL